MVWIAVVVAFRGTEPFNMQDWPTDVNLSCMAGHGRHGPRPRRLPQGARSPGGGRQGHQPRLPHRQGHRLLQAPPPRGGPRPAQGAPAGAARHHGPQPRAAVFPALHGETEILGRLGAVQTYGQPRVGDGAFVDFFRAVQTYGQPRVGDSAFVDFFRAEAEKAAAAAFYRVVYRYDIVPRVPFDAPPVAEFSHGGSCVYYIYKYIYI
ncbi:hypothetical protein ZWY2020_021924 [Hordeum vulgare]|nr:hypothetical protein ZWY2020_021924 [Hordeum vulgare]